MEPTSGSTRPVPWAVQVQRYAPALRADLREQRGFRRQQLGDLELDADVAAAAGDDSRLQVTRVLITAAEAALAEIDAALQRLGEGTYGRCQDCGQPIALERLEVLPMTRLCTGCHHRAELRHGDRAAATTLSLTTSGR